MEVVLDREGNVARRARAFAAEALRSWGWHDVEVAELLVSELASNAVQHTTSPTVAVTVSEGAGRSVRIEVANVGRGDPVRRPPDPTRVGGHGLAVVAELAAAWGIERGAAATTVWFELR